MVGDLDPPRRFRLIVDGLAVAAAAALLLSGYLFYTRISESKTVQHNTVQAIRTVLCLAQQQVEEDPHVPTSQKIRAVRFYTHALARINALPCSPITDGGTP